jgi:hypothetical protein
MAKVCIAVLIPLVLASLAQGHICPEGVCDVQADQTISLLQHDIVAEHGARVRAQLTPKDSGGEGQTNAIMQVGTDSKDSGGEGKTKAMMHVGTDSKDSGGEGKTNAIMQVGTDSKDSGGEGETKAMMQDSGGEGETNAIMQVGTDSKVPAAASPPGCSSDASWGKYNKADGMWWAGSGFFKGHDSGNDRHYRTNWNTPEKCRVVCDRTPKCACFVHNPVGACYMYDSSCLTNTKIANPRVNAYTKCCKPGEYNKADGMWWPGVAGSGFFEGHDSGNDRHYRTNWNTPEKCSAVCDRTPKCACFVHNPVGACYMYDSSCLTNTMTANPSANAYTKKCMAR